MHIKRLFIFLLFWGNAIVLPAQSVLGWLVGQVVDNVIQEMIFSSVKEAARGNVEVGSNNVIDNTIIEAKKKGVQVATRYPEVTISNLDRVLADVSVDSKRVVSSSHSSFPIHNTTLYFDHIANGAVLSSAIAYTERMQNLSKYGSSYIDESMSDSERIRLLLGEDVSAVVLRYLGVRDWQMFANLIDNDEELRRAFQLLPELVLSFNRLRTSSLLSDVDYLCYDYSGALRYIRAGVLLPDSVYMPDWGNVSYRDNNGYTIIKEYDVELARINKRKVVVSNNFKILNVALLPDSDYLVNGVMFSKDCLGRVVNVEGNLSFGGRKKGDDKVLLSFANARKKYSRNQPEQLTPSYIVPLEFGGVCAGVNVLPLQQEDSDTQKDFFREIKKEAKHGTVHVKVTIQYVGASEVPSTVCYSR